MYRLIISTFLNNPLSLIITFFGLIYGVTVGTNAWETYRLNRANDNKIEIIQDSYKAREESTKQIMGEAQDARENEDDWDFINQ
jgi:hypothetical protein